MTSTRLTGHELLAARGCHWRPVAAVALASLPPLCRVLTHNTVRINQSIKSSTNYYTVPFTR